MKAKMTLEQVDARLLWLEAILKNPGADPRAPRRKIQTYKTEQSRLLVYRQKLLTPEFI